MLVCLTTFLSLPLLREKLIDEFLSLGKLATQAHNKLFEKFFALV